MAIELANHIYRDGEGVPVVLMNAYPVDHRMWDVCAKALADFADLNDVPDFPIWAPDMAGSGASPVPSDADSGPRMANGAYSEALDRLAGAYVDLIKAAGYEQAIWVGLSMGGYVAMDIQRLYPETVAGRGHRVTQSQTGRGFGVAALNIHRHIAAHGQAHPNRLFVASGLNQINVGIGQ